MATLPQTYYIVEESASHRVQWGSAIHLLALLVLIVLCSLGGVLLSSRTRDERRVCEEISIGASSRTGGYSVESTGPDNGSGNDTPPFIALQREGFFALFDYRRTIELALYAEEVEASRDPRVLFGSDLSPPNMTTST